MNQMNIIRISMVSVIAISAFVHAQEDSFARHDHSAVHSHMHTLLRYVLPGGKRALVWQEQYDKILKDRYGIYVSTLPIINFPEWNGVKKLYLTICASNDVQLITEDANGVCREAYNSQPGEITDTYLFFGPSNAGLYFTYNKIGRNLYAIFSPYGLQKKIAFYPIEKLPDIVLPPELPDKICSPVFTNYQYYIDAATSDADKKEMLERHNSILKQNYGIYEWSDVASAGNWEWNDAERLYFVLRNTNDIYLIGEYANQQLILCRDSYPGEIDFRDRQLMVKNRIQGT